MLNKLMHCKGPWAFACGFCMKLGATPPPPKKIKANVLHKRMGVYPKLYNNLVNAVLRQN